MTILTAPQRETSQLSAAGFAVLPLLILIIWLSSNGSISPLQIVIVTADIAIAMMPFVLLMQRATGQFGFAQSIVAMAFGLASIGTLAMLCTRFGLPDYLIEGLLVTASGGLLLRQHRLPSMVQISPSISRGWQLVAVLILLLPLTYVFVSAWLGGRGAAPLIVLSEDYASDLSYVQSLLTSAEIPPTITAFAGHTMGYHYGTLEAAAHLVRRSGIPAHAALIFIVLPLLWSAAAASIWLIARRWSRDHHELVLIMAPLALTLFLSHDVMRPDWRVMKILSGWITGHPIGLKPFIGIALPHATVSSGICFSWAMLMLLYFWSNHSARWLAALAIGVLAVFDVFFFASTGLVFGVWSLWQARQPGQRYQIVFPAIALVIGFALLHLIGGADAGARIGWIVFGNAYTNHFAAGVLRDAIPMAAIIAFGVCLSATRDFRLLVCGLAGLTMILFSITSLTALYYGGASESNLNWFRWLFIVPALLAIGTAGSVRAIRDQHRRWPRFVLAALLIWALVLPLLRYPIVALQTLVAPTSRGYDTVDVTMLTEALATIPVKGSLLVVNDLRYPATNSPDNAPVIPAIYGHQCYICAIWPSQVWADEMGSRRDQIRLLQSDPWPEQLTGLAHQLGWTHLLIRKDGPHATSIPLKLLYENQDYAVYQF